MAIANQRLLLSFMLRLISSLMECMQLHVNILSVHGEYLRKRVNIMRMLSRKLWCWVAVSRIKTSTRVGSLRAHIKYENSSRQWFALLSAHALKRSLSYFHRFRVFVWTGENDSNTQRVDADFFKNGEKYIRFQKHPDTCGRGLIHLVHTRIIAWWAKHEIVVLSFVQPYHHNLL